MTTEFFSDASKYLEAALSTLLEQEAQNNLMVGVAKACADASDWLFAVVRGAAGEVCLCAQKTPGHNLLLYEAGNAPRQRAAELLAKDICARGIAVPGVMAERSLAGRFAEAYCAETRQTFRLHETLNLMTLQKDDLCEMPQISGFLRPMSEDDMYFAPYWRMSFNLECGLGSSTNPTDYVEKLRGEISRGALFVWQNGIPVSQAGATRDVGDGISIGVVYTPPHFRGKGYAAACVAALSKLMFQRGKSFCVLYADAANPTSNGVYRRIGYRDIAAVDLLNFYAK